MGTFSLWHWLIVLVTLWVWVFPLWRILKRIGRPPALALLGAIPVVGWLLLWWIALSDWPALRQQQN